MLSRPTYDLSFTISSGNLESTTYPSYGLYEAQQNPNTAVLVSVGENKEYSVSGSGNYANIPQDSIDFGYRVMGELRGRIYLFKAERLPTPTTGVGNDIVLAPDASNLPTVLHNLQSNRLKFVRYLNMVQQVLPQVQNVSVHVTNSQALEILIWTESGDLEREDLAVPLAEGGTGVGHILAILYVVFTSQYSRTIIIDEPQSFLHPGAVRKLIEILRNHPQHQYILTTHSPAVITASDPSTITLIKREGSESRFHAIEPGQNVQIREYLDEIGARLADVFGSDNILWVEGPTEENCFPKILRDVARYPLGGTTILGVKHTGDLEGRHAKIVFEIYDRLSKGQGLLPPAIGFLFDQEGRSQTEQDDIRRASRGDVYFLPRRLYENYLLHPKAIAEVANSIEGFSTSPVTDEQISIWIEDNRRQGKYNNETPAGVTETDRWMYHIHGAKLLADLFTHFSESRVEYHKVTHSIELTEWLIQNAPEELEEVSSLLKKALMKPIESGE